MWFAFSLITIFFWGGSDLFAKKGTNPADKYSHWRLVIIVGLAMGLHACSYLLITGIEYSPLSIIRYFPVAFLYILAMILGYAGLRYIELSVSSPICNSSGAVAAILCFFLLGQRMSSLQFFAVSVICTGIVLLSYLQKRGEKRERENAGITAPQKYVSGIIAILFPVLYCFIDGLGSFMDAYYLENLMDEAEANLSYEFTFLIIAVIGYIYLTRIRKRQFSLLREKTFCVGAVCETAGQFTYVYAMADNAIVAAPMIASYCIFSVLLSRIFLKEKLSRHQYAAILMVMVGIAILGFE
ncbi:MAG: EamA family transporter [Clostridiales bacterium]|nr:EamA family transporter [Clostridiales bacterium]